MQALHRLSNRFAHRFSLFPHHSFDSVTYVGLAFWFCVLRSVATASGLPNLNKPICDDFLVLSRSTVDRNRVLISGEFERPGRRRSVPIDSDSDSDRQELRRGDGGARGVKKLHF